MEQYEQLVSFGSTAEELPSGDLITDANGDLFGTTFLGGADGSGVVYEVVLTPDGYDSTPVTLASFDSNSGSAAPGGLLLAGNGTLFGTTGSGGASGDGSLFALSPANSSGTLQLISFDGADGSEPIGSLIAGADGNLFGVTEGGGASGDGTVFELPPAAFGDGGAPAVLVSFDGADGAMPEGGLIADASGDLFGTTAEGGANGRGTVFEIARTASGYASAPTVLASFTASFGGFPRGSLAVDAAGDLFGAVPSGGTNGDGAIFELARTASGYAATPTLLVSFDDDDGLTPNGSLTVDAHGDLFGTTSSSFDGNGGGEVFEIVDTANGYDPTPLVLAGFGSQAGDPEGGLAVDAAGDLFGTTLQGGSSTSNVGTVFEITGADAAPCFCAGARILTTRGEIAVEALAVGDVAVLAAGDTAPIVWIGWRRVRDADPVRVRAHAFGPGLPRRDLLLSPDHALFVDSALVPVAALADGDAIAPERHAHATYYHVELDRHAILLAEGLPAESYLDTGNRRQFGNAPLVDLHPVFGAGARPVEACAPLVLDGPALEAIRAGVRRGAVERAA